MKRRLAAILAADVVSCSRLMERMALLPTSSSVVLMPRSCGKTCLSNSRQALADLCHSTLRDLSQ
jgi:hypothetical protein